MPASDRSAPDGQTTPFQPEDVLRQAQIQDATLSPDGSTVVYSRRVIADNAYHTHLWIVPWSGGDSRQLTHAAVNDTRPVFSPDGRSLAFISDRGGREQPWILPLDGGEPCLPVNIAGDAKSVHWSPDGQRLLILAPSGVERLTVGDPNDPIARDRRLRLETGQGRITESVGERAGCFCERRRGVPTHRSGMGGTGRALAA